MKKQSVAKKVRRGERWWRELIEGQARSKEPVRELCDRQGVTPQSFYWWRARGVKSAKSMSFTSVEVGVINEYEIRCRSGRSVVVRGAVNSEHLASILMVAEEVSQ